MEFELKAEQSLYNILIIDRLTNRFNTAIKRTYILVGKKGEKHENEENFGSASCFRTCYDTFRWMRLCE